MINEDMPIEEIKPFERSGLPKEEVLAFLRNRLLEEGQKKLKDEYRTPAQGIRTGFDAAFIVDLATRNALIAADSRSEQLLKPFSKAASIDRWGAKIPVQWVIHTVPGVVNIDEYPAIKQHLEMHKEELEKRGGDHKWFELSQAAQHDQHQVVDMKVVFRGQSDWPGFTLEKQGTHYCDAGFQITNGDYYLTGLLNSRLFWYLLGSMSSVAAGGIVNLQAEHFEQLPLPFPLPELEDKAMVGAFSNFCHNTAEERSEFLTYVLGEIAKHLAPGGKASELSSEMERWYILDARSLSEASKRHFGKAIEEDQIQMWDEFLQSGKYELNRLNSEIARVERKLDLLVYRMFGLNEEEIEYIDKI